MTVGSGFELVNASTVTSQQSPVSGQEKVKSLRSKDKTISNLNDLNDLKDLKDLCFEF